MKLQNLNGQPVDQRDAECIRFPVTVRYTRFLTVILFNLYLPTIVTCILLQNYNSFLNEIGPIGLHGHFEFL
jgi:hypothetical protein